MRNIALAAFAFALVVAAGRPAHACGAWSMHDKARHRSIAWGILYVDVFYDVANGKRIAQAEADYEGHVVTITDEHGRTLGSSRADTSDYEIEVSPNGKEQLGEHHSWYWFDVVVKHGGETIITSTDAVGLCSSSEPAGPSAKVHQREEIEARIRAYLDWREKL
jgi:hypothetical protein